MMICHRFNYNVIIVFSTGNTTLTMNTNDQSIHICSAGNGTNGTLLQVK